MHYFTDILRKDSQRTIIVYENHDEDDDEIKSIVHFAGIDFREFVKICNYGKFVCVCLCVFIRQLKII